jgi:hypothetical protein
MTLTQERLKELLHYDPETGVFTWLKSRGVRKAGSVADGQHRPAGRQTYVRIGIDCNRYDAHRLAFLYMTGRWPNPEVDHIDLDGTNNRWSNLREATTSQNGANRGKHRDNKSGFKGVYADGNKWLACIMVNYRAIRLGLFSTKEEAALAYNEAAKKHHSEFARLNDVSSPPTLPWLHA